MTDPLNPQPSPVVGGRINQPDNQEPAMTQSEQCLSEYQRKTIALDELSRIWLTRSTMWASEVSAMLDVEIEKLLKKARRMMR